MSSPLLSTYLDSAYAFLSDFALSELFWAKFAAVYGTEYDFATAEALRGRWASQDFTGLPTIAVVGGSVLGSAMGAYGASNNTIYLSDVFLVSAAPEQVVAVLLEEVGHYVDALVNGVDTPGDEGDYFARLVLGQPVSEQEVSRLQAENDGAVVTIDGVETAIEQNINAAPILTITADDRFYQQIGADIDGEAAEDRSGWSVSLSADGSVVAIGADLNDGNGSNSGHVRIYQNVNGSWTQVGSDIDGEAADDYSGRSVSLSADGSVVAIGAFGNDGNGRNSGHVRVYKNVNGSWTQVGSDIDGEAAGDRSGYSVSLSADGSVVAIGAPYNDSNDPDSGHVRIYQNVNGTWTQVGSDIDGEAAYDDQSGWSVSLSADSSVVAIGAPYNYDNGVNSSYVRIYKNVNGTWTQVGSDINGEAANDWSGYSVSLSADGSVVAIGASGNGGSGNVRIYKNVNGTWAQVGNDIDGEASGDFSGGSVSLSADGSVVAIGAAGNDGNGSNSGHVRIYKNVNGSWTQVGSDIDGEAAGNWSGNSVSLSADGSVVAIGAHSNDGNGSESGHVRVYLIFNKVTVVENQTVVTTVTATDSDGDLLTYTLGGDDAELFSINSNGEITFKAAPDFETPTDNDEDNTYNITVTASDGNLSDSQAVAIAVTDINEAPSITSGTTASFAENDAGTVYATTATDPDVNSTLTYSLGGTDAELFDISNTGVVTFKTTPDFETPSDNDEDNTYNITVTANDGSLSSSQAVAVTVTNVNEAPALIINASDPIYQQIGADIDGEAAGDYSGRAVTSADGSVVAIGAPSNDDNGTDSGHVRVYQNVNGSWTKVGRDINGEAASDRSGGSLTLSADGSVVAIGASYNDGNGSNSGHVRIYQNVNGNWTQVGSDIDGEASGDYSGWSVSLSADGSVVAIGAYANDSTDGYDSNRGHVRVYQNVNGSWTQVGSDINGEAGGGYNSFSVGDESGSSVTLSADGSVVAIGAIRNDGNGSDSGHVRIYQNVNGSWTQVGSDIDGEASGDFLGGSVSLSADGSVVAIGAAGNDGNGGSSGHVRVYQNVNGSWTQVGSDIDGEASGDFSGGSVSLSADGSVVAIGAPGNDGNGGSSGHVRIYQNVNGSWTQVGSDIDGEASGDFSGGSVSLSADGSVVAIGAHSNDGNGSESGHVRVYQVIHQVAVVENQTAVTTVTAMDPDGDLLAYTLGGDDAELFSINSNGEITFKSAPDLENPTDTGADNTYNITVTANDGSLSSSQNVAIAVTAASNEAPTAVALTNTTTTLAENTGTVSRIKVADIEVTDDALGTNILGLSGADSALFEIDGTELYIKAGTNIDFEANPVLDVTVEVDDDAVGITPDVTTNLAISITDVNEAPTVVTLENAVTTLAEDADTTAPVKVADITITDDALGNETITFSGDDASLFEAVGTELFLKAAAALDFETNPVLNITVEVDDDTIGATPDITTALAIAVTNVNEVPSITSGTTASFAENGTGPVYTVIATDPDANSILTYSLGGSDASLFNISDTGVVTFKTAPDFDAPTDDGEDNTYNITVTASDGNLSDSQAVAISVTDVEEGDIRLTLQLLEDNNGTPGGSLNNSEILAGNSFFVEILVQDIRSNAAGIVGGSFDVSWDANALEALSFEITDNLPFSPRGSLDNTNGLADNLGGGHVPGSGRPIGVNSPERFALLQFQGELTSVNTLINALDFQQFATADGVNATVMTPTAIALDILSAPEISISDSSQTTTDHAIQFTTPLSLFRNNIPDSPLVRPSYADTRQYIDISNSGPSGALTVTTIQVNASDVSLDYDFASQGDIILNPGESQRIGLRYAPTTAGQNFNLADGLVIVSNALNDPNAPVSLAGRSTYNADISYDGVVSFGELGPLTANWESSTSSTSWDPTADINGDGFVSFGDLGQLTQQWGQSVASV